MATIAPFVAVAAHSLAAPYTKVEESFTLHAVRDILTHGIRPDGVARYDHLVHPGPLPRSFLGPLGLAAGAKVGLALADLVAPGRQPMVDQVIRAFNAASIAYLAHTVGKTFGREEKWCGIALAGTQFHAVWWAGRTVPNMLAMAVATLSLSLLLQALRPPSPSFDPKRQSRRFTLAIALLALTASIIRAEVVLLLVGLVAVIFYAETVAGSGKGQATGRRYRRTLSALRSTVVAGILGAGLSVVVDSYFWSDWLAGRRLAALEHPVGTQDDNDVSHGLRAVLQSFLHAIGFGTRWVWPELWGLLFNVVEGKSSMWGTSPWYTYLVVHLPKLLLSTLPLAILLPLLDPAARRAVRGWRWLLVGPPAVMVAGLSALGHKEWRFIVYVVPWLNTLAALACAQVWKARRRNRHTLVSRLLLLALVGGLVGNAVVTAGLAYVSHYNYPGGAAMELLHDLHCVRGGGYEGTACANQHVRVFLPPGPRMTGASSYTYRYAPPHGHWEYNTTESPASLSTPEQLWDAGFDYVATDEIGRFLRPLPASAAAGAEVPRRGWVLLGSVDGFGGVERRKGFPPLGIRWRREVGVFGRRSVTEG